MAPISDFSLTLVDGVLNLSTTDTSFYDSENQIYLELKMFRIYNRYRGYILVSLQMELNHISYLIILIMYLNIQITINDDDNPSIESYNDSEFYYNITSTS